MQKMAWVDLNLASGHRINTKFHVVNAQEKNKIRWKDYDRICFSKFLKIIQGI